MPLTRSTGASTIPEGCEDLFDNGEFSCEGLTDDSCAFMAEHPEHLAYWQLNFEEDLGDTGEPEEQVSDFERKASCVEAYLDGAGVEHGPVVDVWFPVTASYAQVEPLCRAAMIDHCVPYALEGECAPLNETECEEIGLCSDYRGCRLEPGADCCVSEVFAKCLSTNAECGAGETHMRGPDGACWRFMETCMTGEPGWEEDTPDCPAYEEWQAIPECG